MAGQRILGQEIVILITENGVLQETLDSVQAFEFSCDFEVKSQAYIGLKTQLKRFVFKGISGSFDLHVHTADYFTFLQDVKNTAQSLTPNTNFTASGAFNFPNGDTAETTFPNLVFGKIDHNVKAAGDFFDIKVPFEGSDLDIELQINV